MSIFTLAVHNNVKCDGCELNPIRGIRYKCVKCEDFDLCEICEQKNEHLEGHLFLKIRLPCNNVDFQRKPLITGDFYPPVADATPKTNTPVQIAPTSTPPFFPPTQPFVFTPQTPATTPSFITPQAPQTNTPVQIAPSPAPPFLPTIQPFLFTPQTPATTPSFISPQALQTNTQLSSFTFPASPAKNAPVNDLISRLGLELLKTTPAQGNIVVSPLSVFGCMMLVANGATGTTATEITTVLGASIEQLNPAFSGLMSSFAASSIVKIANSVWVNPSMRVNENFARNVGQLFRAQCRPCNSAAEVNQWVSAATEGKITSIFEGGPPPAALLINAVYFKAKWENQFNKNFSHPDTFASPSGPVTKTFMRQSGDFEYMQDSTAQLIRLPYVSQGGKPFSAVIILPSPQSAQFNCTTWRGLLSRARSQYGHFSMPKLRIEYEVELKDFFAHLGARKMFDPLHAEFQSLSTSQIYVEKILHKTVLEMDEEGTVAAAVTMATCCFGMPAPRQEFHMTVNRPFMLLLLDGNDMPLFMGYISNPLQ